MLKRSFAVLVRSREVIDVKSKLPLGCGEDVPLEASDMDKTGAAPDATDLDRLFAPSDAKADRFR